MVTKWKTKARRNCRSLAAERPAAAMFVFLSLVLGSSARKKDRSDHVETSLTVAKTGENKAQSQRPVSGELIKTLRQKI